MGRNLKNAVITFLTPLPSIIFYLTFLSYCNSKDVHEAGPIWAWCFDHPLLLANALFFLNVNVLFWVIGLLQSSHWMIDVYWTVIPVMLAHYFSTHPSAEFNSWRSKIVILLTWIWSVRLTHNYFRRELWKFGTREDWRFAELRKDYGKNWWWMSFFAVYLSQQVFLIGVCLPLYVVHSIDKPINLWDFLAVLVCLCGIVIAYFADTQLENYMAENKRLKAIGEQVVTVLDEGVWRYSRHPNYFGEQLWWWGLVIFAWNLGCGWTFVGSLVNTLCLAYVTVLVERRMLKQDYRAEAYRAYQKATSVWMPWFKSYPQGPKEKTN